MKNLVLRGQILWTQGNPKMSRLLNRLVLGPELDDKSI